ncbi:MAG: class I SAM-dependent methyltransferase [Proteobacteria bacterium]|nr:class I SAM-dependent methyltransferase [Pseudomonadota bacterium]
MPRTPRLFIALALCAGLTAAAATLAADTAPVVLPSSADSAALDAAIAGAWRSPANTARDKYRHPKDTLQFFGVRPDQSLIEITPGAGWYTEILAPLLRARGHYFGIIEDPDSVAPASRAETERANNQYDAKLAMRPDLYALTQVRSIDPAAPVLGPPGSADVVLTFRNVHNWVMGNRQAAMFKAMYAVLKPGGTLGVVDHRANPGAATDGMHGYLTEQQVIDYATAAGFKLEAKSEINANPKDSKDWPKGVWTLPPTLALGSADRAKYVAVGESDRMTLRFVKPKN